MAETPEWTDTDLALLQSLDAACVPIEQIERRLGRQREDIEDHLSIARAREGALPVPTKPGDDGDQNWYGPDEEGDVPPARDGGDRAAWVHDEPDQN